MATLRGRTFLLTWLFMGVGVFLLASCDQSEEVPEKQGSIVHSAVIA
ncbi:MAG: hypothetical protein KDE35_04000 [Geminicoccaceae bacterium]|nr:hypothetical protein [Geminicoccaceae bacterium]